MSKNVKMKRCPYCKSMLERIWLSAMMTEEWSWTGDGYNECTAHHSLVQCPEWYVLCPDCESVVGQGFDFDFGGGKKGKKLWEKELIEMEIKRQTKQHLHWVLPTLLSSSQKAE